MENNITRNGITDHRNNSLARSDTLSDFGGAGGGLRQSQVLETLLKRHWGREFRRIATDFNARSYANYS